MVVNLTLKKMKDEIILMTSCRVHDAVSQRLGYDGWSSRVQTRCAAVLDSSLVVVLCRVTTRQIKRDHEINP